MNLFSESIPESLLERLRARSWFRYGIYRDEVFPVSVWIGSLNPPGAAPQELSRSMRNVIKPGDPAFVDEAEMAELTAFFKKNLEEGGTVYLRRYYEEHARVVENLRVLSESYQTLKSEDLSNEELAHKLEQLLEAAHATSPYLWNIIFINDLIGGYLQERLKTAYPDWDGPKLAAFIESISYPRQKLYFQKEKESLRTVDLDDETTLRGLHEEYKWLSMGPFSGRPWDLETYRERVTAMQNDPLLVKNVDDLNAGIAGADAAVASLSDGDLQELVELVRNLIYLKAHRIDIYARSLSNALGLFDEIAKRLEVTFENLLKLTGEEILDALRGGEVPRDFDKRATYLYVLIDGELHYFHGKARAEAEKILYKNDYSSMRELRGRTAYPGVVRGPARVLMTDLDLHKLKKGDILIANLTNPNFDPAFGIVAGVVTDEGGMLCHSAIMAREFKIPCVIATKLATQVFKDGDMLEIDAAGGTVRKI